MSFLVFFSTLLFIQLFSTSAFTYNSLSFKLQNKFSLQGGTMIEVPPIGRLFFESHKTPWQFIITLDEVNFSALAKQINALPPKQQWLTLLQHEVKSTMIIFFLKVVLYGLFGGSLVLLILRIKPLSKLFLYGIICSATTILILLAGTIISYQPQAIEHPQYHGVLSAAPWAMNLVTMSLDNIEVIGNNLKKISQGLPILFKQAQDIKNMSDMQSDVKILHVSDIHNNPAAFDFISELITNFKIQFIIDTGDLTDYGSALEAKIIDRIPSLKVPYVFIPGNHESPLVIKRLIHTQGVIVLLKKDLFIKGLTITGAADPAAMKYNSDMAEAAQYVDAAKVLKDRVIHDTKHPDIIAVHNRTLAEGLIGMVPTILHGHNHQYKLSMEKNTVIDDAGTTGAAGIRGFVDKAVPYSASILYWKKGPQNKMKLHAVDSIKINGGEGTLTVDRRTLDTENIFEFGSQSPRFTGAMK
jgi:predicted phosphodiesterase